jgi:hypothetical protein
MQVQVVNNAGLDVAFRDPILDAVVDYESARNTSLAHNTMLLATENGLMFGNYFWSLPGDKNGDGDQVGTAGCTGAHMWCCCLCPKRPVLGGVHAMAPGVKVRYA